MCADGVLATLPELDDGRVPKGMGNPYVQGTVAQAHRAVEPARDDAHTQIPTRISSPSTLTS